MNSPFRLAPSLATVAASVLLSLWFKDALPDPMPTHWGPDGQPDGWSSRTLGMWLLPAIQTGTLLLVWGLAQLPSEKTRLEASAAGMNAILLAIGLMMTGIHWLTLQAAISEDQSLGTHWMMAMIGGLFLVIGNVMPTLRRNHIAGIRIPQTMRSERVWQRTHRFAGWLFTLSGLATIVLAMLAPEHALWTLVLLMIAPFASMVFAVRIADEGSASDSGGTEV